MLAPISYCEPVNFEKSGFHLALKASTITVYNHNPVVGVSTIIKIISK